MHVSHDVAMVMSLSDMVSHMICMLQRVNVTKRFKPQLLLLQKIVIIYFLLP